MMKYSILLDMRPLSSLCSIFLAYYFLPSWFTSFKKGTKTNVCSDRIAFSDFLKLHFLLLTLFSNINHSDVRLYARFDPKAKTCQFLKIEAGKVYRSL